MYTIVNSLHKGDNTDDDDDNNKHMWGGKTRVLLVTIGSNTTTSEPSIKYSNYIRGKHEMKELPQTAILGTAHTHTHTNARTHALQKMLT